jgi:hypothetical protein
MVDLVFEHCFTKPAEVHVFAGSCFPVLACWFPVFGCVVWCGDYYVVVFDFVYPACIAVVFTGFAVWAV